MCKTILELPLPNLAPQYQVVVAGVGDTGWAATISLADWNVLKLPKHMRSTITLHNTFLCSQENKLLLGLLKL